MDESFNPFDNPNPFKNEKPSQPLHVESNIKPTVQTNIIDDYEPFNNQPAIIPTEASISTQSKVNIEDLEKLQRELDERSRKLAEQEERLNQTKNNISNKNFPPLPKCCPLKPCFYQAIDVEIPEEYRNIVRCGFITWIGYAITLFINIFGTLSYMIVSGVKNDTGTTFGLSIFYCIIFIPLSYIFWFRPLYNAFKKNSSFNFFIFFLVFGCQIVVLIIQVLGINILGSCGWIISISTHGYNTGVMGFMIFIAILFTTILAVCTFIIIRVNMYFRVSGGSMQKAKEEFNNKALSNQTVRSTASNLIRNY